MSLINCTECGRSISDKARACSGCGAPLGRNALIRQFSQSAKATIRKVSKPLDNPIEKVDLAQLLNDISKLPSDFSAGRTLNGFGTRVGGYLGIPGISNLGIVRKHFCIFFIPIIPLGLYLVKDWQGTGGVFLGKISSDDASKYINMRMQVIAMITGGIMTLFVFASVIYIMLLIFGKIS